jgi:DNA-binding CsgD family transcriptional regulator
LILRLGGDEAPRRLLAAALEWSAERLGLVLGGCVLLSPRHEPTASAWGAAHGERADDLVGIAERLQHRLFPPRQAAALADRAERDPAQQPVVLTDREALGAGAGVLALHWIAPPVVVVLRAEGRVAGLIWLAAEEGPAVRPVPVWTEVVRVLRLAHPLLELALRDRWYQGGPDAPIGADLAERGLTRREEAVAALAVEGHGNGEIANRLGIAEHTVKNHMTRVLAKCGVRTRAQLIALYGSDPDPHG